MDNKDEKSFDEQLRDLKKKNSDEFQKTLDELKTEWRSVKKPAIVMVVVIALIAILVLASPSDKERYCENTETASRWANSAAKVYIKRRLIDPDSAVFPLDPVQVSRLGACSFLVAGTVRARNGFGGYVQNTYMAKTEYDIETDYTHTTLISME